MGLKDYDDGYDKQKEENTFSLPDDGAYVVYNKNIRRVTLRTGTPKVEVTAEVIKCARLATGEKSGEKVDKQRGRSFRIDLWWNFEKRFNEKKLVYMIRACNEGAVPDEYVAEDGSFVDTDENLVGALCGTPYGIILQQEHRTYEKDGEKKRTTDIRVLETRHLPPKLMKEVLKDPDVKKAIKPDEETMLEAKDFSQGQAGSGRSGSASEDWANDPDFADDDLPF